MPCLECVCRRRSRERRGGFEGVCVGGGGGGSGG